MLNIPCATRQAEITGLHIPSHRSGEDIGIQRETLYMWPRSREALSLGNRPSLMFLFRFRICNMSQWDSEGLMVQGLVFIDPKPLNRDSANTLFRLRCSRGQNVTSLHCYLMYSFLSLHCELNAHAVLF